MCPASPTRPAAGSFARAASNRCAARSRRTHARICDDGIALDEQAAAAAAATAPPFRTDDWQARQRVAQLGRELRRPGIAANKPSTAHVLRSPPIRAAARFVRPTRPSAPPPRRADRIAAIGQRDTRNRGARESSQIVAWLVVLVGVARARRRRRADRLVAIDAADAVLEPGARPDARRPGDADLRPGAGRVAALATTAATPPASCKKSTPARPTATHGRRARRDAQRRRTGLLRRARPRREPADAARRISRASSTNWRRGWAAVGSRDRCDARSELLILPPACAISSTTSRSSRATVRASRGRGS